MALDAGEALESALRTAIAERLGESRFRLWFGDGVHLRLSGDGESLKVQVPNAFFRQWIQGHFSDSLVAAVKSITGRQVRLSFITQYDVDSPPGGSLNQEHSCEPVSSTGDRLSLLPSTLMRLSLQQVLPAQRASEKVIYPVLSLVIVDW